MIIESFRKPIPQYQAETYGALLRPSDYEEIANDFEMSTSYLYAIVKGRAKVNSRTLAVVEAVHIRAKERLESLDFSFAEIESERNKSVS